MKNFNTKNGLPSNEVYFLHQDKQGFIWACTDAGIARYNGNSFTVFNSSKGLPDNTVFEVKEDKTGKIWFRTYEGAIGYIKNDSVHTIVSSDILNKFIKEGIISSFAILKNGNLLIGRTSKDTCSFIEIDPPYKTYNIKEVWKDKDGRKGIKVVLVGESDYVYSDSRGSSKHYYIDIFTNDQKLIYKDSVELDENPLFTRISRQQNELLLISNSTLHKVDLQKGLAIKKQFSRALVTAFRISRDRIAVGEWQNGLGYLNNQLEYENPRVGLEDKIVTHVIQDYQRGYWYSTIESGIYYVPLQSSNYYELLSDPQERISKTIRINDTTLLIATTKGNVYQFYQTWANTCKWELIYTDKNKLIGEVYSIVHALHSKYILVGNVGNMELDLSSKQVRSLWHLNKGSISCVKLINYHDQLLGIGRGHWFATNKGNYEEVGNLHPSAYRLTSIAYDQYEKRVFVGTLKGMFELNTRTCKIDTNRYIHSRIVDLYYQDSSLLIATRSMGLIIRNKEQLDTIDENKGLISNLCLSVIRHDDMIWVNTNKGLSKITYYGKKNHYVQNYPLSTFLNPNSIGSIVVMKNKLWFSSDNKLFSFDLYNHEAGSRFWIDKFLVNNKPFAMNDHLVLKPNENNIQINYSALFYNSNGNINYRYRINTDDEEWKYTSNNELVFANLSPGDYRFCVEAENSTGKWVKANKQISFTIEKPFWLTTEFFIIALILSSAVIGLMIRWWYLRQLRNESEANEIKLMMHELETKAIKAQMDPHFIFNSLNSIQQFILAEQNEQAYNYLSKFAKLVRKLLESNTNKSITIEDELQILQRYIEMEALRFNGTFDHEFEVDKNINRTQCHIPHMMLQPLIENAIWHGLLPKQGDKKLMIRIHSVNEKTLICEIDDNGVGRSEKRKSQLIQNKEKSLALDLIKERLQLFGKQLNLELKLEITDKKENEVKIGTHVLIVLPVLKN